jgi:hypothetical protein
VDTCLFAIALRNFLRAAELMQAVADERHARPLGDALRRFYESAPDVKDIRDVLEHFDAYAQGRGKLQVETMPFSLLHESTGGGFRLHVIGLDRPAGEVASLDIHSAAQAVMSLCKEIVSVLN